MQIKLVVTDLDGTLLRKDGTISQHTSDVMKNLKAAGKRCVIATGRSPVEAEYSLKMTGADEYMINYTGAQVTNLKTGEIIFEEFFEEESVIKLLEMLRAYKGIFCLAYCSGRTLVLPGSFENVGELADKYEFFIAARKQLIETDDMISYIKDTHIKVNKIFIMNLPEMDIDDISRKLDEMGGVEYMKTMPLGLDIMKAGVNKGGALLALTEHLGLKREEVMIIGDSDNDKAMYQEGFFKVAVENAFDGIKELSDYITRSNNDDGVAYAIEQLVL